MITKGTMKNTLSGIKCPSKADSSKAQKKRGVQLFFNKWLKEIPKHASYAFSGEHGVVGENYFQATNKKCSNFLEKDECYNEPMYHYIRGYPPKASSCSGIYSGKNKKKKNAQKQNQGVFAGITKDFEDISPKYLFKGAFGSGHLGNAKCQRVGLPVGIHLDKKSDGTNWDIEYKCVPQAPSLHVQYGSQAYQIPFSGCDEAFRNVENNNVYKKNMEKLFILAIFTSFSVLVWNKRLELSNH